MRERAFKKVLEGWIGKNEIDSVKMEFGEDGLCVVVVSPWKTKGTKRHYTPDDWPPRKIRVTVEEI